MKTDISKSILMSIPMLDSIFPQLTNQQFINCAFLERTLDLVSPSPVPITDSARPNTTRVSLSRKTRDLLVGVSTVPYCKNGER